MRRPAEQETPGFDEVDHDSAAGVEWQSEILRKSTVLRMEYERLYGEIAGELRQSRAQGPTLEIGSGAGILQGMVDTLITSDIRCVHSVDLWSDAEAIPLRDTTLAGVAALNVFHHLPHPDRFLREAARVLKPGGRIVMVEPTVTPFARLLYGLFHHEPFEPRGPRQQQKRGAMTTANDALAWIWFVRDRAAFETEFPNLHIVTLRRHTFTSYASTGGFSHRPFVTPPMLKLIVGVESLLKPLSPLLATFMTIVIEKR